MQRTAAQAVARLGQPRWGIVTSVDPVNHLVRVMIQPEDVQSGWLPVSPVCAGPGWGLVSLPIPGQTVLTVADCGDAEHGIVVGGTFSDMAQPPIAPSAIGGEASHGQPGEILLVSQAGAVLRLCADGSIYLQGPVNIAGDLTVQGNVAFSGGTLTHDGTDVSSTHRHDGVVAGGDDTGTPIGGASM